MLQGARALGKRLQPWPGMRAELDAQQMTMRRLRRAARRGVPPFEGARHPMMVKDLARGESPPTVEGEQLRHAAARIG